MLRLVDRCSAKSELFSMAVARKRGRYGVWSSIEVAPRDGTQILCLTRHGDYEISHWHAVTQCWVSKRGFLVEATHWMPLPPANAHGTESVAETAKHEPG
jgi:hypothetical protein